MPISVILRHFRAKSDVWGVHWKLQETGGPRRSCLKNLDPRTFNFARKYLISTGISQEKISESFMYLALTVLGDTVAFTRGGASGPPHTEISQKLLGRLVAINRYMSLLRTFSIKIVSSL